MVAQRSVGHARDISQRSNSVGRTPEQPPGGNNGVGHSWDAEDVEPRRETAVRLTSEMSGYVARRLLGQDRSGDACFPYGPAVASATTLPQVRLRRRVHPAKYGVSHRHRELPTHRDADVRMLICSNPGHKPGSCRVRGRRSCGNVQTNPNFQEEMT